METNVMQIPLGRSIHDEVLQASKILLVDDEADNVQLLENILKHWGYTNLTSTTDSRDALELFRSQHPDLIFLDWMMPHMDGAQIIEQLLPEIGNTYVPIVVLTADNSPQTKRRALASGARDFLTKPYDPFEVLLRLQNLLETRCLFLELQNQKGLLEAALRRNEN
jgi:CheY-like chemotaxis protein